MALAEDIGAKVAAGQFEFSRHAVDQITLRRIGVQELREAFVSAEVIDNDPEDKYGPSCLPLGLTSNTRPLHIQCGYPSRPLIKVITAYEPAPTQRVDFRTRRLAYVDERMAGNLY